MIIKTVIIIPPGVSIYGIYEPRLAFTRPPSAAPPRVRPRHTTPAPAATGSRARLKGGFVAYNGAGMGERGPWPALACT